MTLLISIEYRTRWGEQLVLRLGKRRIALQYADGGVWTCAVERYAPAAQPAEYRYEVEREGVCIRSEWRPHTLRIPSREGVRTLRIRDRWQEMPSDTPFYSSAFTRGIFGRGKTGNPKKAAGNFSRVQFARVLRNRHYGRRRRDCRQLLVPLPEIFQTDGHIHFTAQLTQLF